MLILAAAIAVAVALVKTRPAAKAIASKEKSWPVATVLAEPRSWQPVITLYSRVESLWSSQLTSALTADVIAVAVIEGARFESGDLLVRLDDRDARLELAQREADVTQAEARIESELLRHQTDLAALPRERKLLELTRNEVERAQDLMTKQLGAQSALDTARQALERQALSLASREQSVNDHPARLRELQAGLQRAEAQRDKAALDLQRSEIRAPYAGRVAAVLTAPGRRVRPGDALVEIFDSNAMVFRALIPAVHIPELRNAIDSGHALQLSGSLDGRPVAATLLSLGARVGQASGGIEALFRVEQQGGSPLEEGRLAQLELAFPAQPDLIAVPAEAIYGTDRLYLVDDDNRLRQRQVERLGEARGEDGRRLVLVRAGSVAAASRIMATQLPNALEGLLVAPGAPR